MVCFFGVGGIWGLAGVFPFDALSCGTGVVLGVGAF